MEIKSSFGDYAVKSVGTTEELIALLETEKFNGVLIDSYINETLFRDSAKLQEIPRYVVDASEESKQYHKLENILTWMADSNFDRNSMLLAIGGGAIQDIATFISGTFHRGINWTYVPTTLLSQSDSCIGGKCGINLGSLKNQIGIVYPPSRILTNSEFLTTLPMNDLISGLGEILKICVTGENQFWDEYKDLVSRKNIEDLNYARLTELALLAKKYVIEIDELEKDYRRVLNYGHTIGHAIEAASNFKIPHGVGVILGIKVISHLGILWGITPSNLGAEIIEETNHLLSQNSQPIEFSVDKAIDMLSHDKKTSSGVATFIVLGEVGSHQFVKKKLDDALKSEVRTALNEL
jgi:3-dehydroquinate synthase